MKFSKIIIILGSFFALLILACNVSTETSSEYGNPPSDGFNETESDEKAITIADEVMEAMGGRKAWDETGTISWNFLGRRTLTWNKPSNTVSIDIPNDSMKIDLDMNDMSGEVYRKGILETNADTIQKYLRSGKNIWINDSYWLVMPFKLKDSGVTLTYAGKDTTGDGTKSDKLTLTFEGVGVTPNNKYEVLVGEESKLVEEWRFYTNATDTVPRFTTPWTGYEKHGDILLSGGRGRLALTDISVNNPEKEQ